MKILVTSIGKGKAKKFIIEVIDNDTTIYTETVQGVVERDKIVWKLAELYNAVDIDIKEGKEEFMFVEIPTIPVLEEEEADEFFEDNKDFVYERILQAVGEGIQSKRDSIRLFELNGTGVYITSNKADWKNGVQQALDYFLSMELYDKCVTARQLMLQL
jgi:hypothetical protein